MEATNHECYVSLEVAKLLKEAGFDWIGHHYYNVEEGHDYVEHVGLFPSNWNDVDGRLSAPTLDIAQRWLREVKDFHIFIEYDNSIYQCRIDQIEHSYYVKHREWLYNNAFNEFSTYEEAQEAGIKKVLELILEKEE